MTSPRIWLILLEYAPSRALPGPHLSIVVDPCANPSPRGRNYFYYGAPAQLLGICFSDDVGFFEPSTDCTRFMRTCIPTTTLQHYGNLRAIFLPGEVTVGVLSRSASLWNLHRPFATSCGLMTMIFVYYRGCDGAKAPLLIDV
jgi:hypothetical protein